jgi:kynurenine formamidase
MNMARRFFAHCLACAPLAGFAATRANAQQAWSPPPAAQRCPSRWGAADTRGSMNLQTAQQVQKATKLIESGQTVELGHRLEQSMPFFGTRRFDIHLKRTFMNPQANNRGSNEEMVLTEIGQVGTQLDAFPHQTIGDETYNCNKPAEFATRTGFTRMGVDTVGQIFTRGVLIDVAGQKGVDVLPDDYEITVADLQAALAAQGNTAIQAGDVILIRTGWERFWGTDNPRYVRTCPGIGVAAAEWLIAQQPILLGSDNWPVEVAPSKTMPNASLPVHQIALVVNGVHLLENMRLSELAQTRRREFAFILQPLKIAGGTGSTVAPTAVL